MNGAASVTPLVTVVPNVDPTTFTPGDVRVGSHVNGIFLSVFVIGESGAPLDASVNWYIIKTHDQQDSIPLPGNTGVSELRNQIFHEEKGLAGSGDGTAMAFKGVIVLPRGMRRMRQGDKVQISLAINTRATTDANFCVKAIYKSFF